MIKIKRILYPTDLSTESDEGLRYALGLAFAYHAKLILLYCRRPGSIVDWATGSGAARRFQQLLFTRMDADELKCLQWEAAVVEADEIGKVVADEARTRNTDLIVMRSQRRPRAAALLGSTAETVCKTAPCPVLVTHASEREWVGYTTSEVDLRRLLIAYDNSRDADLALNQGLSLAELYQAEIHLLHVVSDEASTERELAWSDESREGSYEIASRRLQEAIPKEACLWCKVVTAVRCGQPWSEITEYAKKHEIDLICMGASGQGFSFEKMFGSTTDRVLRHAPCPVFIARPAAGAHVSAQAA